MVRISATRTGEAELLGLLRVWRPRSSRTWDVDSMGDWADEADGLNALLDPPAGVLEDSSDVLSGCLDLADLGVAPGLPDPPGVPAGVLGVANMALSSLGKAVGASFVVFFPQDFSGVDYFLSFILFSFRRREATSGDIS